MSDPDCPDCQPHDPGNDLAVVAGLGVLAAILWTTALITLIAG